MAFLNFIKEFEKWEIQMKTKTKTLDFSCSIVEKAVADISNCCSVP